MQPLLDKMKKMVTRDELSDILQALGLRLAEKAVMEDGSEKFLLDVKSLEISAKLKDEGFKLKLKIKRVKAGKEEASEKPGEETDADYDSDEDADEDDDGEEDNDDSEDAGGETGEGEGDPGPCKDESYGKLKKGMKKSFKKIVDHAGKNEAPPEKLLKSFLADAAAMTSFADCGAEEYQNFSEAVNGLLCAFEAKDQDAFNAAVKAVAERMESCHARYKN